MEHEILSVLNQNYSMQFDALEFIRDSGSVVYTAFAQGRKFFLRITKPAYAATAEASVQIQVFLQAQNVPVPPIIFTKEGAPFVRRGGPDGANLYVLYEYLEGEEVDPETDAEAVGALLGKLHAAMRSYPNPLVTRDKAFYLDRYLEILQKKQYPRADKFAACGEALWDRVKDMPRGYCHGDCYRGNFLKTPDGRIYVLDFDTSCTGIPMYDPVLICNMTDYFKLEADSLYQSQRILDRFLPEYRKYSPLSQTEADAFPDLVALYHFTLQATIIELFGLDCVDDAFFDRQLDWLLGWQKQCAQQQ